jgi:hypothetical protein
LKESEIKGYEQKVLERIRREGAADE